MWALAAGTFSGRAPSPRPRPSRRSNSRGRQLMGDLGGGGGGRGEVRKKEREVKGGIRQGGIGPSRSKQRHLYERMTPLHLNSAFLTSGHSSALQYCPTSTHSYTRSCTHSLTDGGVPRARRQPARRDLLGRGVLLTDTSTLGARGVELELSGYQPTRSTS